MIFKKNKLEHSSLIPEIFYRLVKNKYNKNRIKNLEKIKHFLKSLIIYYEN
jgi:hypothetical protein